MVSVVAVNPTELVSLRDKVSAWWRPSNGLVSLRDKVFVVAVNPTELVSLRDKVSAWWRPSTGFVSLRDMKIVVGDVLYRTVVPSGHIPVRCQTQETATVTNSPVRGQSSVEWAPPFSPLVPQGRKLGSTTAVTVSHRPDRGESSVERETSPIFHVPIGTKAR